MSALVRSSFPYPKNEQELPSLVRDIITNYDWREVMLIKDEPVRFTYLDEVGEAGIDLTPYDIARQSEMEEVLVGDDEQDPYQVLRLLFERVEESKAWPICFVVDDYYQFAKWLGFDPVRARSRRIYGYPIIHDSRVAEGVVILAATPSQRDGYAKIFYSSFTHYR